MRLIILYAWAIMVAPRLFLQQSSQISAVATHNINTLRKACHDVLGKLGVQDPLLELAMDLEYIALKDQYFIDKKLYPNVDFYSGIILKAMGFPTSMFTVLFAVSRTVGWIAQWNEMIKDPAQRIGRPRQLYIGPSARPYVDVGKR